MNAPLGVGELHLLRAIRESDDIVARAPRRDQLDPTGVEGWLGSRYDREHHPWLRRTLNKLRAAGLIRRLKVSGYVLTDTGRQVAGAR